MWFVVEGNRLLVTTDANSAKVRRIRRNPVVTVAPCGGSGRVRGDAVRATAELLPPGELAHVEQLMARKYRLDRIFVLPIYRLVQRLRGEQTDAHAEPVALAITSIAAGPEQTHSERAEARSHVR
jgi:PPOX class probable F420-dependent enzyme